ncbi:MAG: DUF1629 domain-containing protein [Pirellulales bacterium]
MFRNAEGQAYIYAPDEVSDPCVPDPPRSLAADWSPPTFEVISSDEYRSYLPKKDFLTFLRETMVLNDRAVERLRPILLPSGELLPIYLSNDRDVPYLFNVTRVLNAIDMRRSKFRRLSTGRIMCYERLVFDPSKIPDEPIFFKTTQMGPVTEIFANEAAVEAVKKARLTGHDFRLVWSDKRSKR